MQYTNKTKIEVAIAVVCNMFFDPDFVVHSYVISVERVQPCKYVIFVERVRSCKYMNLEVYFTHMTLL